MDNLRRLLGLIAPPGLSSAMENKKNPLLTRPMVRGAGQGALNGALPMRKMATKKPIRSGQQVPLLKNGYPAHYQDNTYKMQLGGRDNFINYKRIPEEDEGFVGNPSNLNQYSPLNADIANFRSNGSMPGGQEELRRILTQNLRVR